MNAVDREPSEAVERRLRAGLHVVRLVQTCMPLSLSNKLLERAVTRAKLPEGVSRKAASADGVPCEWLVPLGSPEDRVLLYLHGGGFVLGLTPQHLTMVADLSQRAGIRSLLVDYRLGPRHPFPAALEDCVTAYRWLVGRGVAAENIVVAGDSAGGNLTLTTMMALRDAGEPLPAAGACLSPVARLSDGQGASRVGYDPVLHPRAMKKYDRSYVGDHDPADPLISPVYGDWHGLPSLLVHAGEDEILREDALRIYELARAADVHVRLEVYPRMWHVWQLFPELPQTAASLADVAQFLRAALSSSRS